MAGLEFFVSPAKHSDTGITLSVFRTSVCLSVCLSVTLEGLCFAGDTCIPQNAATIFYSKRHCTVLDIAIGSFYLTQRIY